MGHSEDSVFVVLRGEYPGWEWHQCRDWCIHMLVWLVILFILELKKHLCCLVKMYLSALITLIGFLTVKQRRSQTAGALIKKKNRKSQMHRRTSEASTRDCTLFPENRTTFETPEHIKESLCLGSEWLPGKGEDVGTCSMENAGKCSGPIRLDE